MRFRRALISGVTGQDGRYLLEHLSSEGTEILGLTRNAAAAEVLLGGRPGVTIQATDYSSEDLRSHLASFSPDVVFHMTGQTYVGKSWMLLQETIVGCAAITATFLDLLNRHFQNVRFFNASSSEIYASSAGPMDEEWQRKPTNPYGCAKLFAQNLAESYRDNFDLMIFNGIFFNHESPRRAPDFFSRKLVSGVADILQGRRDYLLLGNLDITRDWGCAAEYMRAAIAVAKLERPGDYNICSGTGVTVRDIVKSTMESVGLDYLKHVRVDDGLVRNREKPIVVGDGEKLYREAGWKPKRSIEQVLSDMLTLEMQERGLNVDT